MADSFSFHLQRYTAERAQIGSEWADFIIKRKSSTAKESNWRNSICQRPQAHKLRLSKSSTWPKGAKRERGGVLANSNGNCKSITQSASRPTTICMSQLGSSQRQELTSNLNQPTQIQIQGHHPNQNQSQNQNQKRRPSGVLWQLRHQLQKRSTRKMKTISWYYKWSESVLLNYLRMPSTPYDLVQDDQDLRVPLHAEQAFFHGITFQAKVSL